ncbi:MAG: serine protease, partial [Myxococcales bacterium]|nr:serine protease [Myxococcales bacterium]
MVFVLSALAYPPRPAVVGGDAVQAGDEPDVVGLVFDDGVVRCTGVLVAPDLAVTAAHCFDGLGVDGLLVGSVDWLSAAGRFAALDGVWQHPDYDPLDLYAGPDVAVVRLAEPVSAVIRPLAVGCLAPWVTDGADAHLVGFGYTQPDGTGANSRLRRATTRIRDATCTADVLDGLATGCVPSLRPGGELVAGGDLDLDGDGVPDGPVDTCIGDSGGPLFVDTPATEALAAITSRGLVGADDQGLDPCAHGGVYVRLGPLLDWITDVAGSVPLPTC